MIAIKQVSKRYGNKEVLQHISIQFESGKVYGIVGENGAGKTTLFRCIAGLEEYQGEISSDLSPLKNHLGFLLTDPFFYKKITGEEYIRLLAQARNKDIQQIASKNIFQLPLQQYADTYSTGMKKKLALTALLFQGNQYFILDEPYNGVDIQSSMLITEIIQQLRRLNKTVILSSHIFSTLKDCCDEIFVLHEGRIQKHVEQADFGKLEQEMIDATMAKHLGNLQLE